jgi:uncharacterized alkaline shock family protein YloU
MSDNYPSDVKLNENPNGTVSFATEVVATIAGLAATEVDGVASMISPSSGLADMFSRKSNRNLTKGVRIDLEDNRVSVDVTITVDYGSPIPDVARNIQENVKKAIETMSGLDVKNVDVHVTGISFEREQRANAELNEQHRKMLEKNAEVEAMPKAEGEEKPDAAAQADGQPAEETVMVVEAAWDEDEEAAEGFEKSVDEGCATDEGEEEDPARRVHDEEDKEEADLDAYEEDV